MIHIKKPICTCVTFLMVLSIFASCGNVETDQPSDVTTIQQDSQNSGRTGFSVSYAGSGDYLTYDEVSELYPDKTILVWQLESGTADIRALEVNEYLDSLGKDYAVCFEPMVPFFANSDGKSYTQSVKEKIDNGEQIDIIYTGHGVSGIDVGTSYQRFYDSGYLVKLDDYLLETELGQKLYDSLPEKMWQALEQPDGIYGITAINIPGQTALYGYLKFRADIADKYGYDIEKPMSEQLDILREISDDCGVYKGYINDFGTARLWWSLYFEYLPDGATQYTSLFDLPYYNDFFEMFYELDTDKDGYIQPIDQEKPTDEYFISFEGSRFPIEEDESYYYVQIHDGDTSFWRFQTVTGICSYSEHKDEAFDLLALSLTDEYLNNLLVYGTEEDYTVENGVVAYSDSYSQNFSRFANIFICMPNVDTHTSEEYLEMINNLGELTSNGFSFDSSNVSEQVQYLNGILPGALEEEENIKNPQIKLQLMLYRSEGVDFDTFYEEFKDYMYSLGLQDVIDEYNRQYTEWRNAQ